MRRKGRLEGVVIDTQVYSNRGGKCGSCHRKIAPRVNCKARKESGKWVFYHPSCLYKRGR